MHDNNLICYVNELFGKNILKIFRVSDWECVSSCLYTNSYISSIDERTINVVTNGKYIFTTHLNGNIGMWSVDNYTTPTRLISGNSKLNTNDSKHLATTDKYIANISENRVMIWMLFKWSDSNNLEFSDNIKSIVFYAMCLFDHGHLDDLPIEMTLEILEFVTMSVSIL